jgi:drug/metabolite transporter (DMT)-like permease
MRALDNAYLHLVAATLMWSGNSVAGRLIVGEASPMVVTALRWGITTAALATFMLPRIAADWRLLRPKLPLLALLGTGGYTGFNALFYAAAHTTSAINISILQGAIPLFVFLIAVAFLGQRLRPAQIAGLALGLAGVVAVATDLDPARIAGFAFKLGDLFILTASGLYAVYTVLLRLRPAVSGLSLFTVMATAAALTSLPLVGLEWAAGALQAPTPKGWLILGYIAFFPSFLGQLHFMRAVELIGPARAGLFTNLIPVMGALMGAAIGEPFGLPQLVGLVLVVGGILWAERGRSAA